MMYQQNKTSIPAKNSVEKNLKSQANQKRKRVEEDDCKISNEQLNCEQRTDKTIFRPWCDSNSNASEKIAKTMPPSIASPQYAASAIAHYANPPFLQQHPSVFMSPYQLAIHQQQQQQQQAALYMQQAAMYQRQMFLAHMWLRHHQHQQQHRNQMQMQPQTHQQMFTYSPQLL